jgi:hypothetical protein
MARMGSFLRVVVFVADRSRINLVVPCHLWCSFVLPVMMVYLGF